MEKYTPQLDDECFKMLEACTGVQNSLLTVAEHCLAVAKQHPEISFNCAEVAEKMQQAYNAALYGRDTVAKYINAHR